MIHQNSYYPDPDDLELPHVKLGLCELCFECRERIIYSNQALRHCAWHNAYDEGYEAGYDKGREQTTDENLDEWIHDNDEADFLYEGRPIPER